VLFVLTGPFLGVCHAFSTSKIKHIIGFEQWRVHFRDIKSGVIVRQKQL